jgi:hypothetical protein
MLVAVVETFQNHVDEFAGLVGTVGVLHKADGQMSEGKEGGDSAGGENEPFRVSKQCYIFNHLCTRVHAADAADDDGGVES